MAGIDLSADATVETVGPRRQTIGVAGILGVPGQVDLGMIGAHPAARAGGSFTRHAAVVAGGPGAEAVVDAGLPGGRVGRGIAGRRGIAIPVVDC